MFPKFISQFFQAAPSPSNHSAVNNAASSSLSTSAHQTKATSSVPQQDTQGATTKNRPGAGESGAGTMEAKIRAKIDELKKGSPMEIRGGSIEGLATMIVKQEMAQEGMAAASQQHLEKMNAPLSESQQQDQMLAQMQKNFGW